MSIDISLFTIILVADIHLLIKPIREDRLTDASNSPCDKYQRTISDEGKCLDMINEQIVCGISFEDPF